MREEDIENKEGHVCEGNEKTNADENLDRRAFLNKWSKVVLGAAVLVGTAGLVAPNESEARCGRGCARGCGRGCARGCGRGCRRGCWRGCEGGYWYWNGYEWVFIPY